MTSFLFIFGIGFSQTKDEQTIFKDLPSGKTNTITLNTSYYSPNVLGKFKDDLLSFNEKILKVSYNESNKLFLFTYSSEMSTNDLIELFKKHHISYTRN